MTTISPLINVGVRVAYIPLHAEGNVYHPDVEYGTVSSINYEIGYETVYVRFDKQVCRFGWEQTTAQGCNPDALLYIDTQDRLDKLSKFMYEYDGIMMRPITNGLHSILTSKDIVLPTPPKGESTGIYEQYITYEHPHFVMSCTWRAEEGGTRYSIDKGIPFFEELGSEFLTEYWTRVREHLRVSLVDEFKSTINARVDARMDQILGTVIETTPEIVQEQETRNIEV